MTDQWQVRLSELFNFFAKQRQATKAADTHKYTLYGGSRGPGKSYWLRWYPIRFLIKLAKERNLRHVRAGLFSEDYPTLTDRQVSKIQRQFPAWLGELKETRADGLGFFLREEYGGGALLLRNLDEPSKYVSAEFALIAVEELTRNQVQVFNDLRGSLRWPGVPDPKFIAAANPGGVGHLWVKSYWIDTTYPPELVPYQKEFAYVRALPDDNPYLDESYWEMLNSLPPKQARAWRYGDWDVFEGQVFDEWQRDQDGHAWHVMKPKSLPAQWPRWRAVDWGYVKPFCCLWLTQDLDSRRVYVEREAYQAGLRDQQQARLILRMTPKEQSIDITYADPSMWTKKSYQGQTFSTADQYEAEGVILTKADNDRETRVRKVHSLLGPLADGKPALVIFENCANLIRTLPALVHDKVRVEDVDTDGEDHAYDALGYGLTPVDLEPEPPDPEYVVVKDERIARALRRGEGLFQSEDF